MKTRYRLTGPEQHGAKRKEPLRPKKNVFKFRRAAWEMEELRAVAECGPWGDFYQFIAAALQEYARKEEAVLGVKAAELVKLNRAARRALRSRQWEIGWRLSKAGITTERN